MKSFARAELAEELSIRLDIPLDRATHIADACLESIKAGVLSHGRVEFRNFGALQVVQRKTKVGLLFGGKKYTSPAHRTVVFKTSQNFQDILNIRRTNA